jgi:hypothetical protein
MSRKFRIWDSAQIHETVKHGIQLRAKLEQLCIESGKSLDQLPDSLVPSILLYMLVSSNEAMYSKLLDQDLIETLNPKHNVNIH